MEQETFFFFEKHPEALPIYEAFERRVLQEIEGVHIRVQKTQITFTNPRVFACVSFLRVRKAKEMPPAYLVVTIGTGRRIDSPRIDAAVEPYPNRWTHHLVIAEENQIDDELMAWVREAAAFAASKRPGAAGSSGRKHKEQK